MNLPLSFQIDLTMADGVMKAAIKEGDMEASVISERMDDIQPLDGGGFRVRTSRGEQRARHVLLHLQDGHVEVVVGRRGLGRRQAKAQAREGQLHPLPLAL